jgi:hypothetical protein
MGYVNRWQFICLMPGAGKFFALLGYPSDSGFLQTCDAGCSCFGLWEPTLSLRDKAEAPVVS